MAKNSVPQMVLHRPSGQAYVRLPLPDGKRRVVYLGPHGTAETKRRYRDTIAKFLAGTLPDTATAKAPPPDQVLVSRLCLEYLTHARAEYRNEDGEVSRFVTDLDRAATALLAVCRNKPAAEVTCADLFEVREQLLAPMANGVVRSRKYVNSVLVRVKGIFRWGCQYGLVPGGTWHALSAFRGLGIGRGGARETPPVEAIPRAVVDAILPHLPEHLRTAIEVLWWSGARAGELCDMTTGSIDRSGPVWLYRPARHKGAWRGRDRVVRLGPKCQELLRPLLKVDPNACLFSPRQTMAERFAERRAERQTRVQPSQVERAEQRAAAGSPFGDRYEVSAIRRAVHRACDAAQVERFGLHRLRHSAGTRLVLACGDDAARVQLGHSDARMVRRYSRAADAELGAAVAAKHA